jgi:hypothetical protein
VIIRLSAPFGNSSGRTNGGDSSPSQYFLYDGSNVRQSIVILEGRGAVPTDDAVNFLLGAFLNIGIEDHGKHKPSHLGRGLYENEKGIFDL